MYRLFLASSKLKSILAKTLKLLHKTHQVLQRPATVSEKYLKMKSRWIYFLCVQHWWNSFSFRAHKFKTVSNTANLSMVIQTIGHFTVSNNKKGQSIWFITFLFPFLTHKEIQRQPHQQQQQQQQQKYTLCFHTESKIEELLASTRRTFRCFT